jgi:hypothetical protein
VAVASGLTSVLVLITLHPIPYIWFIGLYGIASPRRPALPSKIPFIMAFSGGMLLELVVFVAETSPTTKFCGLTILISQQPNTTTTTELREGTPVFIHGARIELQGAENGWQRGHLQCGHMVLQGVLGNVLSA